MGGFEEGGRGEGELVVCHPLFGLSNNKKTAL